MTRVLRLLSLLWPWRWWRSARALAQGVRLHPSAQLLGSIRRISFGQGCVIGARVRIDVRGSGVLQTGTRVWLAADTEVDTDTVVRIADGTTVQRRCSLNGSVRIGRGCLLAPNVFMSSGTHAFRDVPHLPIREQDALRASPTQDNSSHDQPVWIQDDCWLGINVVVLPGVTIGKGSIVGANAVVTQDVAPYSVVGGAPAHTVATRLAWRPPQTLDMTLSTDTVYVLCGAPVLQQGRAVARAVSVEEPFCAVLSASVRRVQMRCRASAPLEVLAGEVSLRLQTGTQDLLLEQVTPGFGGVLVALRRVVPGEQATLQILSLQGLTEGASP